MAINDVIIISLVKTIENNGKMRTSAEPNKIYIIRKVLVRAIQKCNLSHCVSYEHLCQICHNHSPNMVMVKIRKFLFFA